MRRREFITLIGGAAMTWPLAARAQQHAGRRRVSVLMGSGESDPKAQARLRSFVQSMRELGWIDGDNVTMDFRWANADADRTRIFAKELVELQPDLIVSNTTPVTVALQRETKTIPIVFVIVSDPVGAGLITSLAQPGGNMTGFINYEGSIAGKWLELLKEIDPRVVRAAILYNPITAAGGGSYFLHPFEAAARSLGITALAIPVSGDAEIEASISALGREPGGGLVMMGDNFMSVHRAPFIAQAARNKVPAVYPGYEFTGEGGLISYGPDYLDIFRRAGPYVDRILKGAKPGELPVQVPTRFQLIINLKTAKALGLEVPLHLQQLADEVIE
jgi:putative tryptophan/tyrosine transport system substrate-binding protein